MIIGHQRWDPLPTSTKALMLKAFAHTTWDQRTSLWSRLTDYLRGSPVTAEAASAWVDTLKDVTIQAKYSYAKTLLTICNSLRMDTFPIRMLLKGLVAIGALIPIRPAKPLTPAMFHRLRKRLMKINKSAAVTATMAWVGCGRWSETAAVTRAMCPEVTPERVIVAWGQKTKSSRLDPWGPSMFTVFQGTYVMEIYQHLMSLHLETPVTTWTTQQVNKVMRALFGKGYTTHSLKHGAIAFLFSLVREGKITIEEVMRIAKHKSIRTTLRYGGLSVDKALLLGTQRCTELMP